MPSPDKLDPPAGCNGKFLFIALQLGLMLKPTSTRQAQGFVEGPLARPSLDAVDETLGKEKSRYLVAETAKWGGEIFAESQIFKKLQKNTCSLIHWLEGQHSVSAMPAALLPLQRVFRYCLRTAGLLLSCPLKHICWAEKLKEQLKPNC